MNETQRIKELRTMLEVDEPELWATSNITPEQAEKELEKLEQIKLYKGEK